jgi:hypothetical protein
MSDAFRAAVEAADHEAMTAELADDVLFYSPVAFTPFSGKESVAALLGAVMSTFTEFSYSDELEHDGTTALVFNAKVGDTKVQGLDFYRRGDDGKISEFTVMLRPANGLMAMAEAMGPKVAGLAKGEPPK